MPEYLIGLQFIMSLWKLLLIALSSNPNEIFYVPCVVRHYSWWRDFQFIYTSCMTSLEIRAWLGDRWELLDVQTSNMRMINIPRNSLGSFSIKDCESITLPSYQHYSLPVSEYLATLMQWSIPSQSLAGGGCVIQDSPCSPAVSHIEHFTASPFKTNTRQTIKPVLFIMLIT